MGTFSLSFPPSPFAFLNAELSNFMNNFHFKPISTTFAAEEYL